MDKHKLYRYIIDWLYPNLCPICEKLISYDADFCDECKSKLTLFSGSYSIENVDKFTAYCIYDDVISPSLLKFKKDCCGNSYYAYACGIQEALKAHDMMDFDVIVSIPITKEKMKERTYNQTELIADELMHLMNIPHVKALEKPFEREVQKSLSMRERFENLKGAFVMNKNVSVDRKRVLVIDDICTTGSTLCEAARVLKEAGAAAVYGAAFAKTERKYENTSETLD